MGQWLDTLHPQNNDIPDVWDQFLDEFQVQFQDSSVAERACQQLERLCMSRYEIDEYILDFEKLARKARYTAGNPETTYTFLKGLPQIIREKAYFPTLPATFEEPKTHCKDLAVNAKQMEAITQSVQGGSNQNVW